MKKYLVAATMISLALSSAAVAKSNDRMKECASQWRALKANNAAGTRNLQAIHGRLHGPGAPLRRCL